MLPRHRWRACPGAASALCLAGIRPVICWPSAVPGEVTSIRYRFTSEFLPLRGEHLAAGDRCPPFCPGRRAGAGQSCHARPPSPSSPLYGASLTADSAFLLRFLEQTGRTAARWPPPSPGRPPAVPAAWHVDPATAAAVWPLHRAKPRRMSVDRRCAAPCGTVNASAASS